MKKCTWHIRALNIKQLQIDNIAYIVSDICSTSVIQHELDIQDFVQRKTGENRVDTEGEGQTTTNKAQKPLAVTP